VLQAASCDTNTLPLGDRIGAFLGLFSCRYTSLIRVASVLQFVWAAAPPRVQ